MRPTQIHEDMNCRSALLCRQNLRLYLSCRISKSDLLTGACAIVQAKPSLL